MTDREQFEEVIRRVYGSKGMPDSETMQWMWQGWQWAWQAARAAPADPEFVAEAMRPSRATLDAISSILKDSAGSYGDRTAEAVYSAALQAHLEGR